MTTNNRNMIFLLHPMTLSSKKVLSSLKVEVSLQFRRIPTYPSVLYF